MYYFDNLKFILLFFFDNKCVFVAYLHYDYLRMDSDRMKLQKKYGLMTAITMVVGIVIGSGVFFKAQTILQETGGNVIIGMLAWIIGGINMLVCAIAFSILATKYGKINGLVDYTEETVGKKYSDFFGIFLTFIYFPAMASVLAWVTARYAGVLFGWELNSANVMVLSIFFLLLSFTINALAPKIAGKVQVSTTVIKLIPLGLMMIVGVIYGLINTEVLFEIDPLTGQVVNASKNNMQILVENFKVNGDSSFTALLAAIVSASFAYEGWIVATSINGELKNAKRNLPIALIVGCLIIMMIYVLYFIGVLGGASSEVLINGGTQYAFFQIFGNYFGEILNVFVVVSCFGTLNGLMLACTRSFYTLAERGVGIRPKLFNQIDEQTNMPTNSAIASVLVVGIWLVFFYATNLTDGWFGDFKFDSSELPLVTIYAMYIPIFIMMIVRERKSLGVIKGIVCPILAILSSLFMVYAAIVAHKETVIYYLISFVVVMSLGVVVLYFNYKNNKKLKDIIKE